MTYLIDANVLLDLFTEDRTWVDWSRQTLYEVLLDGSAVINPVIYSEVSAAFASPRELDEQLHILEIVKAPLPYAAAFPAMRAFIRYRRTGGSRHSPLPDFYIGAHALVDGLRLATRDGGRYQTYFPDVDLLTPQP